MTKLMEECLCDSTISKAFLKAVKTKGSKLYLHSVIGLVKLTKSQFNPRVGCTYIVYIVETSEETQ